MKVLVTGAAGFIGSNLCHALIRDGHEVTGADDLSSGRMALLHGALGHMRFVVSDFADLSVRDPVSNGHYDAVVHLAAIPSVPLSFSHPALTEDVNVLRSIALIQACKKSETRMVFSSSAAVYGNATSWPIAEDDPPSPISPYGFQKLSAEMYLRFIGVEHVILRFFNVYGPRQLFNNAYASVVSSWCRSHLQMEPLVIEGGAQTRDMCHVDDVVEAISVLANPDLKLPESPVFNVASGHETSIDELARLFSDVRPGTTFVRRPRRPGDIDRSVADVRNLKAFLPGPRVTLRRGLTETIEWYEREGRWVK